MLCFHFIWPTIYVFTSNALFWILENTNYKLTLSKLRYRIQGSMKILHLFTLIQVTCLHEAMFVCGKSTEIKGIKPIWEI